MKGSYYYWDFKHIFSRFGINVFNSTSGAILTGNLRKRVKELAYFIFRDVRSLYRMHGRYRAISNPVFSADLYIDE